MDKQDRGGRTGLSLSGPSANDSRESSSSNRHFPTDFRNKSKQALSNSGKRSTTSPVRSSPNRSELQVAVPFLGFPPNADVESLNSRLQKLTEENHVLTDKLSNTRRLLDRREREFIVERQDLQSKVKDWQASHSDFFKDVEAFKLKLKYYEDLEEEVEELRKCKTRLRGKSKQRSENMRKRSDDESKGDRDALMIRGSNGNNQELEQDRNVEERRSDMTALMSENDLLREELNRHRLYIEDLDTLNHKLTEKHQRNALDGRDFESMQEEFQRRLDEAFRDRENIRLECEQKLTEQTGELLRLSDILENRERHLEEAERQIYELRHNHSGSNRRDVDVDSECEIPRFSSAAESEDDKCSQRGRSRIDEALDDERPDERKRLAKELGQKDHLERDVLIGNLELKIEELNQMLIKTEADHIEEVQSLMNVSNSKERGLKGRLDQFEMTDNIISVKALKNTNRKLTEQIDEKEIELKMIRGLFEQSKSELIKVRQEQGSGQTGKGVERAELEMAVRAELEAVSAELLETKQECVRVDHEYKILKSDYETVLEEFQKERAKFKNVNEEIEILKQDSLNNTKEKDLDRQFTQKEEEFQKVIEEKEHELDLANEIIEKNKSELEKQKTISSESVLTQDKIKEMLIERDNDLRLAQEAIEQYKKELQDEKDFYVQSMLTQEKFENILEEKEKDLELANEANEKFRNEIDEQTALYSQAMVDRAHLEEILQEKEKEIEFANEAINKHKKDMDEVSLVAAKNIESDVNKYSTECAELKEIITKKSQKLKELEEELKKCKESIEKLSVEKMSEENAGKRSAKDLVECKKILESHAKEIVEYRNQIERLKRQLEECEQEKQKIEISHAVEKKAAISETKELQEMTATNAKLERALVRLKLENEDLRAGKENNSLLLEKESHIRDLQKEVSSLRASAAKTRPLSNPGSKVNDFATLQHKYEAILTAHRKLINETSSRRPEGNRRRSSSPNISSHRSPADTHGRIKMNPESSGERIAQLESWLDEIYNDPDVVVHPPTHGKKGASIAGECPPSDRMNIVPTLPELKHSGLAQNRWRNRAVAGRGSRPNNYEPRPAWDARKNK